MQGSISISTNIHRQVKTMPYSSRSHLRAALFGVILMMGCSTRPEHPPRNFCERSANRALDSAGGIGSPGQPDALTSSVIDVNSLLDEMSDLHSLAYATGQPFHTCLSSSYDRASVVPATASDTPTAWYANQDWSNYAGENLGEHVLLDTDGPGAIVRIWSATPSGTLRLYLDGDKSPALDANMGSLLSGRSPPFSSPFAGTTANGFNLEFPFPFREHAKVTWEGGGGFYQVTYRLYAETSANLMSFALDSLDGSRLAAIASSLQGAVTPESTWRTEQFHLDASSPEATIAASPGGEEVVRLEFHPSRTDAASLRGSILSMNFDGLETVRVPLGDFFGAGPGLLPHRTLPLEVTPDGTFIVRFSMPFQQVALVRLDVSPGLEASVTVSHRPQPFDVNTRYFHAHWTARGPMPSRPYRDLLLADLSGKGTYVGTMLAVGNSSTDWWGEGDEKIWVDDDAFPSLFGTGTEDYFGQGYCSPSTYSQPFRAQSLAAGGFGAANGLFALFRAHILDPIQFTSSLKFNLELWHWDDHAQVTFDTVVYFYLASDGADNLQAAPPEDFRLSPFGP